MSKSKSTKKKKTASPATKASPKKAKAVVKAKKPKAEAKAPKETKLGLVIELLSRAQGASNEELVSATGWKPHTVRACISHALGKKRGFNITSEKGEDGTRVYKIIAPE